MVAPVAADKKNGDVAGHPDPREPSAFGGQGGADASSTHPPKENTVSKWTAFKSSTIVKVSASAGTLVAVAVVVGAGFKWN